MNDIKIIEKEIDELKEKLKNCKGTECAVYSRIVGYYMPIKNWNSGKRQEFEERKLFET